MLSNSACEMSDKKATISGHDGLASTETSRQFPTCQGHSFVCRGLKSTGMQPAMIESTSPFLDGVSPGGSRQKVLTSFASITISVFVWPRMPSKSVNEHAGLAKHCRSMLALTSMEEPRPWAPQMPDTK